MIDSSGGSAIEMWRAEDAADAMAAELQHDVWDELRAEPELEPCLAAVAVYIVGREATLVGVVQHYPQKVAAGRAARRVRGITRLVNSIRIDLPVLQRRTDQAIAEEVRRVLEWDALVPADRIDISVRDAEVTLRGQVDREHQRAAVEQAVEPLVGILGVRNEITVRPLFATGDVQPRVVAAIRRLRSAHVQVKAQGGVVALRGRVASLADQELIDRTVRQIPGVVTVEDSLIIER